MPHENRGGKRTPEEPAAVSGPGSLSQRTDGGPGRLEFGNVDPGVQGEAQALREQQEAGGPLSPQPRGPGGTAPPVPATDDPGAFTPTDRPLEPETALPGEDRIIPEDPIPMLRAAYIKHPTEDLRRLIEWADRGT